MDPSLIIGLVLAFGSVVAIVTLEGSHISSLLLPPPMILVFGATIAVGLAGNTVKDTLRAFKAVPRAFLGKAPKPQDSIDGLITLAEKARSEGLLALEAEASEAGDAFLAGALQNVADGTDAEELRILMEDQIATKARVDHADSKFFAALGGYAPTIGIIGTVVSLTHVLENLSSPDQLGPMIASAFVATLWGLLSANFIWLPISARIARLSELEVERMNLVMEGVLAMQGGAQPLLLADRLRAMVADTGASDKDKGGKGKGGRGSGSRDPESAAA
ncbi:motility protein A [Terrabacter carboxydivorans]|uniref:Flagellar motor protein n=1 Tax=Terrabacter carboxydivorans TaxID=619730 RepID=A0ABN3LIK8_9MICO